MSLLSFFQTVSLWAPIVWVRDSQYGMPAVQSVHLTGLTILLATMLALNLRLAGLALATFEMRAVARHLRPWMAGGAATAILSGFFIFVATPGKYLGSYAFRVKMLTLLLAILFHFLVLRSFVSNAGPRRTRAGAIVAFLSLTLWFGVGWAGRAIAFVP